MIELREDNGDLLLPIHVHAGARRSAVGGEYDGRLRVRVTAAPEKGKANRAIVQLLAKRLGLRKRQVAIAQGHTSQEKLVRLSDLTARDREAVRAFVRGA